MHDQAIHWLLRQRAGDMTVAEWEELTAWLEADPAHSRLLDQMVQNDVALDALVIQNTLTAGADAQEEPVAANDNPASRFIAFAMATAAAAALAFFAWPGNDPVSGSFTTQPGELQTIALTDEITMTLNGDSAVAVSGDGTFVDVERGEVAFAIISDEPSALRVTVADMVLTDYGTVFNVSLKDDGVSVAVKEGIVAINPDSDNVQIAAGEWAEKAFDSPALQRGEADPDTVASWREGRLEFDDTSVEDAMLQLRRSQGIDVTLAPRLSNERLTGSIVVSGDKSETVESMAEFLGGTARIDGDGWIIE